MSENNFSRETMFKVVEVTKLLTTMSIDCQVPTSKSVAPLLIIKKSEYGSIDITTVDELELVGNLLDVVFDANDAYFRRPSYETATPETYSNDATDGVTDAYMLGVLAARLNLDISASIIPPATSTDVSSHGFKIVYHRADNQIELSDADNTLHLAVTLLQVILSTHYKHFC